MGGVTSGKLAGLLAFREQVLDSTRDAMDFLAGKLVGQVNQLHRSGVDGYGIHPLRMIASAHRHHAAPAFFGAQRAELVVGAAFLEGCGVLQIFKFQEHLTASDLRERARGQARCRQNLALDASGRSFNISKTNHGSRLCSLQKPCGVAAGLA